MHKMPRAIFENIVIQKFESVNTLEFCKYTSIRFFEILFIEKGEGNIIINEHKISYSDKQIFILIPDDKYNLEIEKPTTVSAIKFLNSFFSDYSTKEDQIKVNEWFKKIEIIFQGANRTSQIQLNSKVDETSLLALFTVLCNEYSNDNLKSEVVLESVLHTVLHILSRNVVVVKAQNKKSKIQDILNYIHFHIHNPEKLSKRHLATQFNISENYISEYFKNKMNIGLKKYIITYKIKLAETRLKYTNLTITEIAQELGFTDSSHLDKTFLNIKGVTANTFKKNNS